ncbi:hypothetical protein HZC20_01910 [Candidatus Peregrinibacteria bacterium]|nr:hypothetical protein [Candidatus Peregrinibacteria bacterium]
MGTFDKIKKMGVLRAIYLYVVTSISIILVTVSTIGLLNIVISEYILKVKDWEQVNMVSQCDNDMPGAKMMKDASMMNSSVMKEEFASPPEAEGSQLKIGNPPSAGALQCEKKAAERAELTHVNNLKRDLANWLSMLIIALPLYFYHWGVIKKEGVR